MKIYTYKNCSTCKKATKFLDQLNIKYTELPIRETPPSKNEIKSMLKFYDGQIKKMFNTSGQDYRNLGIKDRIDVLSENELVDLLHSNGNLIKRPFLLDENFGFVGFKEDEWKHKF